MSPINVKIYENPMVSEWDALCKRPTLPLANLEGKVQSILDAVKEEGDDALRRFAKEFDSVAINDLRISKQEIEEASQIVPAELKQAIALAAENIRKFHSSQQSTEMPVETIQGVVCWRKSVPISNVGLYIPGGSAPLFSTILMLAIPAQIAGCSRLILCTPTNKTGKVNPIVLYTANYLGINEIYKIGGAQAIAAMAYGTQSVPKVDKIFGPGNQFVTKAKELVQKSGIAIDLPAGPSEVLVMADSTADADFIAADLLSQAEHGADSQVVLLATDTDIISQVVVALQNQLKQLPRAELARKALENSIFISFQSLNDCIDFSNLYAPEHLILSVNNAEQYIDRISNAGSVFLGNYACESAGDYASGTNHTLPTNGYARSYSGVSLDSFVKKITFQKISKQGLKNIGKTIEVMAEAEQLLAHKNAVSIRLKKILNDE